MTDTRHVIIRNTTFRVKYSPVGPTFKVTQRVPEIYHVKLGEKVVGSNIGMPPGGATGFVLTKLSSDNYDTGWLASGGGGSGLGIYYNVQDYGAISDGTGDQTASIELAAAAAVLAEATLYFPEGDYAVTGQVDIPAGCNIIMDGTVIYTGVSNITTMKIGSSSGNNNNRYMTLRVRRTTSSDWQNEASIGVNLVNAANSFVIIHELRGFTIGLRLEGRDYGCAYNNFMLHYIVENGIGIDLYDSTSGAGVGYVDDNKFYGGFFGQFEDHANKDTNRIGIRIKGDGSYANNNANIFYGPAFELDPDSAVDGLGTPTEFLIENGRLNKVVDARVERKDLKTDPVVVTKNDASENYFGCSYLSPADVERIDDQGENPGTFFRYNSEFAEDNSVTSWNSGTLAERAYYKDGGVAFRGMNTFNRDTGVITESNPGFAISQSRVITSGISGVGIFLDTRKTKRFVVTRDVSSPFFGRMCFRCFSSVGAVLVDDYTGDTTVWTHLKGALGTDIYFPDPDTSTTMAYVQSSEDTGAMYLIAQPDTAFIHVSWNNGEPTAAIMRSFSIHSVDNSDNITVFGGITPLLSGGSDHDNMTSGDSPQSSTFGIYSKKGTVVHSSDPSEANGRGWVCTVAGSPGTWEIIPFIDWTDTSMDFHTYGNVIVDGEIWMDSLDLDIVEDKVIYMGAGIGSEYLRWDFVNTRFEFSTDLHSDGSIHSTGSIGTNTDLYVNDLGNQATGKIFFWEDQYTLGKIGAHINFSTATHKFSFSHFIEESHVFPSQVGLDDGDYLATNGSNTYWHRPNFFSGLKHLNSDGSLISPLDEIDIIDGAQNLCLYSSNNSISISFIDYQDIGNILVDIISDPWGGDIIDKVVFAYSGTDAVSFTGDLGGITFTKVGQTINWFGGSSLQIANSPLMDNALSASYRFQVGDWLGVGYQNSLGGKATIRFWDGLNTGDLDFYDDEFTFSSSVAPDNIFPYISAPHYGYLLGLDDTGSIVWTPASASTANMILNGYAEYENTTGWETIGPTATKFTFNKGLSPVGHGAFVTSYEGYITLDKIYHADPALTYNLSCYMKSVSAVTQTHRIAIVCYDIDDNEIGHEHVYSLVDSQNVLNQAVEYDDPALWVTDNSGWDQSTPHDPATQHLRYIGMYGYANSYGYVYEGHSYTRDIFGPDAWDALIPDDIIDLNGAWTLGSYAIGSLVANNQGGDAHEYPIVTGPIASDQDWHFLSGTIKPRAGTAYIRVEIQANGGGAGQLWIAGLFMMPQATPSTAGITAGEVLGVTADGESTWIPPSYFNSIEIHDSAGDLVPGQVFTIEDDSHGGTLVFKPADSSMVITGSIQTAFDPNWVTITLESAGGGGGLTEPVTLLEVLTLETLFTAGPAMVVDDSHIFLDADNSGGRQDHLKFRVNDTTGIEYIFGVEGALNFTGKNIFRDGDLILGSFVSEDNIAEATIKPRCWTLADGASPDRAITFDVDGIMSWNGQLKLTGSVGTLFADRGFYLNPLVDEDNGSSSYDELKFTAGGVTDIPSIRFYHGDAGLTGHFHFNRDVWLNRILAGDGTDVHIQDAVILEDDIKGEDFYVNWEGNQTYSQIFFGDGVNSDAARLQYNFSGAAYFDLDAVVRADSFTARAKVSAGDFVTLSINGQFTLYGDSNDYTATFIANGAGLYTTFDSKLKFSDRIYTDIIEEYSSETGVTIDGLLIKDGGIPSAAVTVHEGDIVHQNISGAGTNNHAAIDTHLALVNEHIDWTNAPLKDIVALSLTTTGTIETTGIFKASTFYVNPGGTVGGISSLYFRGAVADTDGLLYFLHGTDSFTINKPFTVTGAMTATTVVSDIVSEKTADTGVTVDSLLIKDGDIPALITGRTEETAPTSDDMVLLYEATGATNKKVALANLPAGSAVYADETGAIVADVWNVSGAAITAGSPVYISGYNVGSDLVEIEEADASAAATMPALGVVRADISNGSSGLVDVMGSLNNMDTSGWSVGDPLYVSETTGELTNTRPTGATVLVQKMGLVLRSHATLGIIGIIGAGRTNDVPNIAESKYWVGDSNGVASEVNLDEAIEIKIEGTVDERFPYVVPFDMTITGWTMFLDVSGSMAIGVWKDSYANHPPTIADVLVTPSVTSAIKNQATGLSLSVTKGEILMFNVNSVTTAGFGVLALTGVRA